MAGAYRHVNNTVAAHDAAVITASDTTQLEVTRGVYVGGNGNLSVCMVDSEVVSGDSAATAQGVDVIFYNVPAGTVLPIQVVRVLSTGTTATNLLALY